MNYILITLYLVPVIGLILFAGNLYMMVGLYLKRRRFAADSDRQVREDFHARFTESDLPLIVTQLPLYNEYNVAERVMRAAVAINYPAGRHIIQVLDDSTDETCELIDGIAAELVAAGHDLRVVRREQRVGFKAGALENGMRLVEADFFAIFDADFIPSPNFLLETIPVMLVREKVGFVQARWGHCNVNESVLTRIQAVGIDGHFGIEQPARAWNGHFMNFNGTAGLWRRQAIDAAGGWEHDTLTEDMDLSYRSQLAGWDPYFMRDLVVPAELPADIIAFKSQQFRWAKGAMQTGIKLLPRVMKSDYPLRAKIGAALHMGQYLTHPFMVMIALLTLPILVTSDSRMPLAAYTVLFPLAAIAMVAPAFLYGVGQLSLHNNGLRSLRLLPVLSVVGIGLGISNSRAVYEALIGKTSDFVRTPKKGDRKTIHYTVRMPVTPLLELLLGLYCFYTLYYYCSVGKFIIGPFIILYGLGFTTVGVLSLVHLWKNAGVSAKRDATACRFKFPRGPAAPDAEGSSLI